MNKLPLEIRASLPTEPWPWNVSTFLYRVAENDDDGDPLDHGMVSVRTSSREEMLEAVIVLLRERFTTLGLSLPLEVKVYHLAPPPWYGYGLWEDAEQGLAIVEVWT